MPRAKSRFDEELVKPLSTGELNVKVGELIVVPHKTYSPSEQELPALSKKETPARQLAHRRSPTVRLDIDRAVAEVLDPPARQCRPDRLCEVCRRDIREESLQWLRELAE